MPESTVADMDAARADLAPLFTNGYMREIMTLRYSSDATGRESRQMQSARTDDLDDALQLVADADSDGWHGIFVSVNPNTMPGGGPDRTRPKSEHVPLREALFLDFDVQTAKAEKRPATDDERHRAHRAAMHVFGVLQRHGFTGKAQRTGTSGNGAYLLFALDNVPADDDVKATIGAAADVLAAEVAEHCPGIELDTDCATDPVRVRRVSGTVNRRHGGTSLCRLVYHPDAQPLPFDVLESIAGDVPRQADPGNATAGDPRDTGKTVPTETEAALYVDIMRTDRSDGNRHSTALAYGGFMAHSGIARTSALAIIRQVAADDQDMRDREKAVNDSYDRFEAGHPVGWKNMLPASIVNRLKAARQVMRARVDPHDAGPDPAGSDPGNAPERFPVVLSLEDVEEKPIDWLWPGWLARSMLTILGGYGGDGKSTLTMALTAYLTRRNGMLPDGARAPCLNVLILAAEDDPAYAIKPRLRIHGADMARVHILKGIATAGGKDEWFNIARDAEMMREAIHAHDIDLVIIDPLSSYMPKADRNSEGDVRDALMPLQVLMEQTGVGVLGIMHVGKADAQRKAAQRLLGSTAFTALARCVWMVHDLPEEHQPEQSEETYGTTGKRKALGVVKANYSLKPPALAWSQPLDGAIVWHGKSPVGIEEAFAADTVRPAPKKADAETFLQEFLKGGSKPAREVYAAAESAGIKTGTLRSAKDALGIEALKDGYQGEWLWSLPRTNDPDTRGDDPKGSKVTIKPCTGNTSTFGDNGAPKGAENPIHTQIDTFEPLDPTGTDDWGIEV